jgi:hypothetical protein
MISSELVRDNSGSPYIFGSNIYSDFNLISISTSKLRFALWECDFVATDSIMIVDWGSSG